MAAANGHNGHNPTWGARDFFFLSLWCQKERRSATDLSHCPRVGSSVTELYATKRCITSDQRVLFLSFFQAVRPFPSAGNRKKKKKIIVMTFPRKLVRSDRKKNRGSFERNNGKIDGTGDVRIRGVGAPQPNEIVREMKNAFLFIIRVPVFFPIAIIPSQLSERS